MQTKKDFHKSIMTAMLMFTELADPEERQGSFKEGTFIEHRCICMPAHLMPEELEAKENKFLRDNPDW